MIIKYKNNGNLEWARLINEFGSEVYIQSIVGTEDGKVIAGGLFDAEEIKVGDEILTNFETGSNGNERFDSMIIEYNSNGEVEDAKSFGGSENDYIYSITETMDGKYVVGGYFESKTIQILGNEIITNSGNYANGLIIKYTMQENANTIIENIRGIGGDASDHITSVAATSDGGYIAGGYFDSEEIQVGNKTITNNGGEDGLIIKYNGEGEVEWAKSFGGSGYDEINSVTATKDGGYVAGGFFSGDEIQVGDISITNNGAFGKDGIVIKYSSSGEVEWAESFGGVNYDEINSVVATENGGYVVAGTRRFR